MEFRKCFKDVKGLGRFRTLFESCLLTQFKVKETIKVFGRIQTLFERCLETNNGYKNKGHLDVSGRSTDCLKGVFKEIFKGLQNVQRMVYGSRRV